MILHHYALDALNIIKQSIQLHRDGHQYFYRVVALQLRMLLCDTTRRHGKSINTALVPRVFPDLSLPILDQKGEQDPDSPPLPLTLWLDQKLASSSKTPVTIHQFIRRVCDQDGGAHVDPKPVAGFSHIDDHETLIIRIGSIVADELEARFLSNP